MRHGKNDALLSDMKEIVHAAPKREFSDIAMKDYPLKSDAKIPGIIW